MAQPTTSIYALPTLIANRGQIAIAKAETARIAAVEAAEGEMTSAPAMS
ncbi:hypothetical protein BH23ACT9_BH23ACT9_24270 [soil metagenome]